MAESVIIFDKNRLGLSPEYVVSNIESLFGSIDGSFDYLEPLPTDLRLLVVFAMREVIESGELFAVEDGSLLPPSKLSEYIMLDKEREALLMHRLESIVRWRGKLRKS